MPLEWSDQWQGLAAPPAWMLGDGNIIVPDAAEQPAGEDGSYDAICETIEFVINTNVVGVTGEKGSNLFFQMEARDPNIPPAPAIPSVAPILPRGFSGSRRSRPRPAGRA